MDICIRGWTQLCLGVSPSPLSGYLRMFERVEGVRAMRSLVGLLVLLLVADSAAYTGAAPSRRALASRSRPALLLGQDAADEVLSKRLEAGGGGTLLGATALVAGAHGCPSGGGRVRRHAGCGWRSRE